MSQSPAVALDAAGGFVCIDKPTGWTSHDVVARVRRILGTRRVGHAGTLDPLATGVLVLGVGRATRLLGAISGETKTYEAIFRLGETTTTDDAEGESVEVHDAGGVQRSDLEAAIAQFRGEIPQRPSSVSAIKVAGRRAYDRVRAGEQVVLPARTVHIFDFQITEFSPGNPDVAVRVRCSSGTYVRALARDVGAVLGVGAHVIELRRTAIGPVTVEDCQTMADFAANPRVGTIAAVAPAWLPTVTVAADEAADLSHGRATPTPADLALTDHTPTPVLVLGPTGDVVCQARADHGMLHPTVVFAEPYPYRRKDITP